MGIIFFNIIYYIIRINVKLVGTMKKNLIKDFMRKPVDVVKTDSTLKDVIDYLTEKRINFVPVVNSENLIVGVFNYGRSSLSIVEFIKNNISENILEYKIENFMNKNIIVSHPDDDINDVYEKMVNYKLDFITIIDDNDKPIGTISVYQLYEELPKIKDAYDNPTLSEIEHIKATQQLSKENLIECLENQVKLLYTESITDPLTGLFNTKYFKHRVEEEVERSKRHKEKISIIFMDLDHFKNINDTYGHEFGNKVLINITKSLRRLETTQETSALRKSDIPARYGGEEFVILLPSTSKKQATKIAERLRKTVAAIGVKNGDKEIHVTISIGVAEFDESNEDILNTIERADSAMYEAKRKGRNCVVVA